MDTSFSRLALLAVGLVACHQGGETSATDSEPVTSSGALRGFAVCEVQYVSSANTTPAIDAAETRIGFDGTFPKLTSSERIGSSDLPYGGRADLVGTTGVAGLVTLAVDDVSGARRATVIVPATLEGLNPSLLNYRNFGELKVPVAPFQFRGETYDTVAAHCAVQVE